MTIFRAYQHDLVLHKFPVDLSHRKDLRARSDTPPSKYNWHVNRCFRLNVFWAIGSAVPRFRNIDWQNVALFTAAVQLSRPTQASR